jgi:hypothetical protein
MSRAPNEWCLIRLSVYLHAIRLDERHNERYLASAAFLKGGAAFVHLIRMVEKERVPCRFRPDSMGNLRLGKMQSGGAELF